MQKSTYNEHDIKGYVILH